MIQCNVANSICSKETKTCVCMDGYELDANDEDCVPIEVSLQISLPNIVDTSRAMCTRCQAIPKTTTSTMPVMP
jgi:hypothetical protein